MFERYTELARRALFFARYEASMLGGRAIETEHLLLGLLKDRELLITHLLDTSPVTADAIRQLIYTRVGAATSPLDTSVEIPFSEDAKQVLEYTAEEANRLLHQHIGCEHLLLGLLRLERGLAWDVLRERGVELTSIREALVLHVSATSPPLEIAGMLAGMLPRAASHARRSPPVYSMSALDGPSPGRRATSNEEGSGGFTSFSTVGFATAADRPPDGGMHSIGPISMSAATLSQFVLVLEPFLNAAVMDDTGLTGRYDIELQGQYDSPEALSAALRDQLGLVLTKSLE